MRTLKHIGIIIPDGYRRWAEKKMIKEKSYVWLGSILVLFKLFKDVGIKEVTFYGHTTDNVKRPVKQHETFTKACENAVNILSNEEAELLVVGDLESPMFPKELTKYTTRQTFGNGGIKVNFLVNYSSEWDLNNLKLADSTQKNITSNIKSFDVSRIDLIIRWGGRRRLSGFLPVQSIYSDFYVLDDYWPNFNPRHFYNAIKWYYNQDVTVAG